MCVPAVPTGINSTEKKIIKQSIHSLPTSVEGCRGLEPIPAHTGQDAEVKGHQSIPIHK